MAASQDDSRGPPAPHCEQSVDVKNAQGLHARPAELIAKVANRFQSAVRIRMGDRDFDAKRMLSVLQLAAQQGTKLRIGAWGDDAEQAVAALVALIESNFDEELAERLCAGQ